MSSFFKMMSFICLLFLFSCARLTLDARDCRMNVTSSPKELEETSAFEIRESVYTPWAPLQTTEIDLEDLLKTHKISCSSVKQFEFSFESDAWDASRSLFPFTSHKTLVIKGLKVAN